MKRAVYSKPSADERPTLTAMPIRLIQLQTTYLRDVRRDGDRFIQSQSSKPAFKGAESGPNPWQLRAAFDRVRMPEELMSFLRMCGRFKFEDDEQSVSWEEAQHWQAWFREQAEKKEHAYWEGWPSGLSAASVEKLTIQPDIRVWNSSHRKAPFMAIHCETALETIAATIFIDGWNGAKYGKCEWCGSLYRITTLHKRGYCTPAHLRLALRKQDRKRKQEAKVAAGTAKGSQG